MSIYKEMIKNMDDINNCSGFDEEKKKVEYAKNRAMSNERRAITELFKEFKFEVTDGYNVKNNKS